jgi:glycosyltransferase involved in cell wall biosynthesis
VNAAKADQALSAATVRPKVLYLANNYPNVAIPRRGLWAEGMVRHSQDKWDSCVVAPVPHCPPIPFLGENYSRFRRVPGRAQTGTADVFHPRALTPPGGRFRRLEGDLLLACVEKQVESLARRFQFEVIHAHFTYPEGWVSARLGERLGIPVVITEHSSWRSWSDREPTILRRARWAVEHCAAHVSVGTALHDEIREIVGDRAPLSVIPCGVDETIFAPPPPDVVRRPHQLLFVGAVRAVKGLDVLLKALAILRGQGRKETLTVIGDSFFSAYVKARREAEAMARDLGLGEAVTFLGGMDPTDVARAMQQSAVLVSPSHRETLGLVLIEALACGTPVVATLSGGPADIVTADVGRLIPVGDPKAMAEAIAEVVDANAKFPVDRLRAHALSKFNWTHVTDSYLQLYLRILGKQPPV